VQDPSKRVFTFVDYAESKAEGRPTSQLFLEGVMGSFLGLQDSHFAVLETRKIGSDNIAVYEVSKAFSDDSLLGYTYVELGTGDCVTGLWPGPPASYMLEDAEYDANGELIEKEAVEGGGLALVTTQLGNLMLVLIPDVRETPADAELEPCSVQSDLQLLENEKLLQVCLTPPLCSTCTEWLARWQ
jgi:hypothetical protein